MELDQRKRQQTKLHESFLKSTVLTFNIGCSLHIYANQIQDIFQNLRKKNENLTFQLFCCYFLKNTKQKRKL